MLYLIELLPYDVWGGGGPTALTEGPPPYFFLLSLWSVCFRNRGQYFMSASL